MMPCGQAMADAWAVRWLDGTDARPLVLQFADDHHAHEQLVMQTQVRLIPHATNRRVALKILRIIVIASRLTTGEEQPEGYP